MALTNTLVFSGNGGDRRMHVWKINFDSSYATGGEALTASDLGFNDHASLLTVCPLTGPSGFTFEYDAANAKLKAYSGQGAHTHTENTAGAYTQSATTGAVTAATFNVGSSEVASGIDLSAVTVVVAAFGKNPSI